MRYQKFCLVGIMIFLSFPARPNEGWQWQHKKLTGIYGIYGGGLGDPVSPTAQDKKVMFSLDGQSARELFDAIGPDVKDACLAGSKVRVRKKDREKLACQRNEDGTYYCNFGFDLRNGKSIGGIIC